MSVILKRLVKEAKDIVVGVEFLIHDPIASLAIAKASGAKFIRTDYFVDKMSRAKFGGMIPIDAKKYMDYRKSIGAEDVVVFTDLQVKYAKLEEVGKTFDQSAKQAKDANSDGLIVTGKKSGFPPNVGNLTETRKGKTDLPIIVGSGFSPTNAEELLKFADAAIVGTSMMTDGVLQKDKIQKLMAVVKKVRREL